VKAPPSKKPREEIKKPEPKSSSSRSSSQESQRPLDEKFYERDLEAAITLSLLNNANRINDQLPTRNVNIQLPADENSDPSLLRLSNCSVDGAMFGLDEITFEKKLPAQAKQKKTATNPSEELKKKLKEDDEDYQPKPTADSESDDDFSEMDESENEEFTLKKVSKTKKKEKVAKNEKAKTSPVTKKEKQPSKTSKSKLQAAGVFLDLLRSPPKPAVSLSPAGGRIPKWNPPGQIGKCPTSSQSPAVKSPGQGLRLGLSRLVRVKPLHPSVASH
uniref:RAD51 interacting motif domain-containing protein n=1 Tax=Echeneis naucrates TaxID=173247 RepID=A0A665VRN7_ECHNA